MSFEDIAKDLIEAVEGLSTPANIKGVVKVFEGIKTGVYNEWQEFLIDNTNETLLYNDMLCDCGRLVEVKVTGEQTILVLSEAQ